MSQSEPIEFQYLRALKLINDQHGYIKPGQVFRLGWTHEEIDGTQVPKTCFNRFNAANLREWLLADFSACDAYYAI